jgi:hypothetical protein
MEYFPRPAHLFTRCIQSRYGELTWVQTGKCIGVPEGFARSSPSKVGNDGSAKVLVRARRRIRGG